MLVFRCCCWFLGNPCFQTCFLDKLIRAASSVLGRPACYGFHSPGTQILMCGSHQGHSIRIWLPQLMSDLSPRLLVGIFFFCILPFIKLISSASWPSVPCSCAGNVRLLWVPFLGHIPVGMSNTQMRDSVQRAVVVPTAAPTRDKTRHGIPPIDFITSPTSVKPKRG